MQPNSPSKKLVAPLSAKAGNRPNMSVPLVLLLSSAFSLGANAKEFQAYPGARLPPEQETLVQVQGKDCHKGCRQVQTFRIDGKRLTKTFLRTFSELRLTPGKHTIEFRVFVGYADDFPSLWFVGEAGKTYQVRHEGNGYGYNIWITDSEGNRVGGVTGSGDEPKS